MGSKLKPIFTLNLIFLWGSTVRVVTFKASEEFINLLENYALQSGLPRSVVIRRAVIEFINRYPPATFSKVLKPKKRKVALT